MTAFHANDRSISRRTFVAVSSLGVLSAYGCAAFTEPTAKGSPRLSARPSAPTTTGPKGLRALGLGTTNADGMVYVPASYSPSVASPLALLLHGAGGSGAAFIPRFIPEADATGQILLAVDSRKLTWDGMGGTFGEDMTFLDRALADTFGKYNIDARRIAIGGFSDGATESLAIGLATGDLFGKIAAWSPGGLLSKVRNGKPGVFISHGTADPVLPIDASGRDIADRLRESGYSVDYHEFNGGHELPADQLHTAMVWMAT